MHPGVTILRYLVPYVGYIGGFIAWSWSAIRSFDKGLVVFLACVELQLNSHRLWRCSDCYVVAPVPIDTWHLGSRGRPGPEHGNATNTLGLFVTLLVYIDIECCYLS